MKKKQIKKNICIVGGIFSLALLFRIFFLVLLFHPGIHYPGFWEKYNLTNPIQEEYSGQIDVFSESGLDDNTLVVFTVTQNTLDKFAENHSRSVFADISDNSIYGFSYENEFIVCTKLDAFPYTVTKDYSYNIGEFIVDRSFLNFFSKRTLSKVLKKNGVTDEITNITLMKLMPKIFNTDSLIAWIQCGDEDYFVCWDRCWQGVDRYKEKSFKHFFAGTKYNYFSFYDDTAFKTEFTSRYCDLTMGQEIISKYNTRVNHIYAYVPLFKIIEAAGFETKWMAEDKMMIVKDDRTIILTFEKHNSWSNVCSMKLYRDGKALLNDFIVCDLSYNDCIITDEDYRRITNIIGLRLNVDYENKSVSLS